MTIETGLLVMVAFIGLQLMIAVPFVWHALRRVRDRDVDGFSRASGIAPTEDGRQLIRRYLVSSRRLRTLLVIAALVASSSITSVSGVDTPDAWQSILGACLVGTIWAELRLARPEAAVRSASLRPRDVGSYLGRPLLWSPAVVGIVAAIEWLGVASVEGPRRRDHLYTASTDQIVVGAVFALAVPLLVALTQRWIVSRPQPFGDQSLVAADDAVRAASVRFVAAVATAMALINLSGAALHYTYAYDGLGDIVFGGTAFGSLALAWFYWNARKPGRLMPTSRTLRPSPGAA